MKYSTPDRFLVPVMACWVNSLAKWQVFATHTFAWEASLWSARRVYERFMRQALPGLSYFYAIEQNPSRDGHHIHAIWDSAEAPRKATHKEWLKRYGRNRIEPVRGLSAVEDYCAKYVCKDGAWWEFHLSRSAIAKRGIKFSPLSSGEFSGSSELVEPTPAQPRAVDVTSMEGVCESEGVAGRVGCRVVRVRDLFG